MLFGAAGGILCSIPVTAAFAKLIHNATPRSLQIGYAVIAGAVAGGLQQLIPFRVIRSFLGIAFGLFIGLILLSLLASFWPFWAAIIGGVAYLLRWCLTMGTEAVA